MKARKGEDAVTENIHNQGQIVGVNVKMKVNTVSKKEVMVRFVCSHCSRALVWADAAVTVRCPSCGRWIQSNRFWRPEDKTGKRKKNPVVVMEQLELF